MRFGPCPQFFRNFHDSALGIIYVSDLGEPNTRAGTTILFGSNVLCFVKEYCGRRVSGFKLIFTSIFSTQRHKNSLYLLNGEMHTHIIKFSALEIHLHFLFWYIYVYIYIYVLSAFSFVENHFFSFWTSLSFSISFTYISK